jgi:ubiquinone biosynthesis protein
MEEQVGLRGLEARVKREAPLWSQMLPQIPRLVYQSLVETPRRQDELASEIRKLRRETDRRNRLLLVGVTMLAALAIMAAWAFIGIPLPGR